MKRLLRLLAVALVLFVLSCCVVLCEGQTPQPPALPELVATPMPSGPSSTNASNDAPSWRFWPPKQEPVAMTPSLSMPAYAAPTAIAPYDPPAMPATSFASMSNPVREPSSFVEEALTVPGTSASRVESSVLVKKHGCCAKCVVTPSGTLLHFDAPFGVEPLTYFVPDGVGHISGSTVLPGKVRVTRPHSHKKYLPVRWHH